MCCTVIPHEEDEGWYVIVRVSQLHRQAVPISYLYISEKTGAVAASHYFGTEMGPRQSR